MSEKNTRDFVKASADLFGDSQILREKIKHSRRTSGILTEDRGEDRVDEYRQGANPDPEKGCLFCGPHKMTEEQLKTLNVDLTTGHAPLREYSICEECRTKYQIKEGSPEAKLWEAVGVKFIGTDENRTDAKIDKTKVKMDNPPKNQGFQDETKDSVDRNTVKMDNPPGSAPSADQVDTKATGSMKHGEGPAYVKYQEPGGAWREFEIPDAIFVALKRMAGVAELQEGKYKCEKCGVKFSQEKKLNVPIACPKCKGKKVEILEAVPGPDDIKDTEKKESPTVDKTKVHMDKPPKNVGEAGTKVPAGPDDTKAKNTMGAKHEKFMDKGGKWREKDAALNAHSPTKEMVAILTTWGFMKDGQKFKDLPLETQAKLGALADTFFEKCEVFFGEAAEGFEKKNISDASDTMDSVDRKKSGNVTVGKKNIGEKEVPSGPSKVTPVEDAKAKASVKKHPVKQETAKPVKTEQVVAKSYLRGLIKEDDEKALSSMKHGTEKVTDKGGTRRDKGTEVHALEKPLKKDREGGGKETPEFKGDEEPGKKETVPADRHEAGKKEKLPT